MIWIAIALMTALAALSVLMPLARGGGSRRGGDANRAFYETQMAELERDRERGLLGGDEYAAAKAEAARRLISSHDAPPSDAGPLLWRRRVAALVGLIATPALALGIYGVLGQPALQDRPLQARLSAPPDRIELVAAVAKIEKHLRRNPNDGNGWQVIAPVYTRMRRYSDAAQAWQNAIRLLGPAPNRFGALGEALVFANKGVVNDQALAAFAQALKLDPDHNQALFFTGLAAQQSGANQRAREIWSKLIARAPKGAPWVKSLQQRVAELDAAPEKGPPSNAGKAIAALPVGERAAAIRGMVDGLAARLRENGKDIDGWMMLVRAYMVLKQPGKAREALRMARQNFAGEEAALRRLDEHAKALGVGD